MSNLCDVYWNSHRECFSIRSRGSPPSGFTPHPKGRVFYNTGPFLLVNPVFRVSEKGRQRVLRTGKKTVHATIRGLPRVQPGLTLPPLARRVRYNPFKNEQFVLQDGTPVHEACAAYFVNNGVWIS